MKAKIYILAIVLVEAAGFAADMLTREGTQIYAETINKPPLSPPGVVSRSPGRSSTPSWP